VPLVRALQADEHAYSFWWFVPPGRLWQAYGLSMLGRIGLLRGDLDQARQQLEAAIYLADRSRWLSFLPWPQALLGAVQLAGGELTRADETLHQAFARAAQLEDPCWEGMSARGLALVAEASGDVEQAFSLLADARERCNRHCDAYTWLDAYILDAQSELGLRHGHPGTSGWVESLRDLASRTGMRELTVRSMLHGAALGNPGDATAATLLAADIDNPLLVPLLVG